MLSLSYSPLLLVFLRDLLVGWFLRVLRTSSFPSWPRCRAQQVWPRNFHTVIQKLDHTRVDIGMSLWHKLGKSKQHETLSDKAASVSVANMILARCMPPCWKTFACTAATSSYQAGTIGYQNDMIIWEKFAAEFLSLWTWQQETYVWGNCFSFIPQSRSTEIVLAKRVISSNTNIYLQYKRIAYCANKRPCYRPT